MIFLLSTGYQKDLVNTLVELCETMLFGLVLSLLYTFRSDTR